MPITIVHPGNESVPKAATPPARLASLKGKKIGLLDISKPGGSFFLDRLEEILRTKYGVGRDFAHAQTDIRQERSAADHRATASYGRSGGRFGGLRIVYNVQFARHDWLRKSGNSRSASCYK